METEPKQQEETAKEKKASPLEISEETKAELTALFEGKEWNGEKFPPVSLTLYSLPHKSAEDFDPVKPYLDTADIYVPEFNQWSFELLDTLQDVSDGEMRAKSPNPFVNKLFESLFDTHKKIAMVDVYEYHAIEEKEKYISSELDYDAFKKSSFEEAVEKNYLNKVNIAQTVSVNREQYMVRQFAESLRKTISDYPDLQEKQIVRVLMTLGDSHSAIYHTLKNIGGDSVSRVYSENPINSLSGEIERRTVFGKEVSQELKEKSLFELLFNQVYYNQIISLSKNTHYLFALMRYYSGMVSSEEIRFLFEKWKTKTEDEFLAEMEKFLDEKKVPFPKNEEDLNRIIAKTTFGKYQATLKEKEQQKNESAK